MVTTKNDPAPRDLRALVREIQHRLCAAYGCPVAYFGKRDPLSQLVSSLLSQRTTNKNKSIAFKSLREALPTWEQVRDAPVATIEDLIRVATYPEQKAPRLKALLAEIEARTGGLSLDFLEGMSEADVKAWLMQLHGVGPKTASAVLSFSALRMRALPVDVHHYRVAKRLELIGPSVGEAKAHDVLACLLPENWTAQDYYDHHEVMMFHGQRCCFIKHPKCRECVLLDLCPTGQARLGENLAVLSAQA